MKNHAFLLIVNQELSYSFLTSQICGDVTQSATPSSHTTRMRRSLSSSSTQCRCRGRYGRGRKQKGVQRSCLTKKRKIVLSSEHVASICPFVLNARDVTGLLCGWQHTGKVWLALFSYINKCSGHKVSLYDYKQGALFSLPNLRESTGFSTMHSP